MKNKEIKRLLEYFDKGDDISYSFSGFKDPEGAKKMYKDLSFFRSKGSGNEKDFSPYFTDKVMRRLLPLYQNQGIEEYLSKQFTKVMTFGFTAVILALIALYFIQGQDGMQQVIDSDPSNDINFISYIFYEF